MVARSYICMLIFLMAGISGLACDSVHGSESALDFSNNSTNFAYITDTTPRPLPSNDTINVSVYNLTDVFSGVSADIVLLDVDGNNVSLIQNAIDSGNITGELIPLTPDAKYLSTVDDKILENVSSYWTYSKENLRRLLVYLAVELDRRADLKVEQPLRTSILLVVLPNADTISGIVDELGEYGIDCRFANLTALSMVGRNEMYAQYVIDEIENFNGDIIFEYVADRQYSLYKNAIENASNRGVKALGIGGFSSQQMYAYNVNNSSTILKKLFSRSSKSPGYWRTVLPENLKRMFIYIAWTVDERADLEEYVKPTMVVPPSALYHPDGPSCTYMNDSYDHLFLSWDDFFDWYVDSGHYNPEGKWIGIVMYYRDYQEGKLYTEDAMIRMLEDDGYNAVACYVPWRHPITQFFINNTSRVDAIISFNFFGANGPWEVLDECDVPVLKAISLSYQTYDEWENNPHGLHGLAITWKVDQPEMDGVICPIATEARITEDDYMRYPINDRLRRILGQAEAYANLRHVPNSEKRVAIIYFNHPPGKHDIGASYLNLFESLENVLNALNSSGYDVKPMNSTELQNTILIYGRNVGSWAPGELEELADRVILLDASLYERWFSELPQEVQDEVINVWGQPPGDMMVVERDGRKYIVIPAIQLGNVLLAPQPARGWEEDLDRLYHDLTIPPPHQYIAFYLWLQKSPDDGGFGAHAVVHMGRHGTLEWLPGKMVCLNETSYPDLLLGNIPDIYPYIVDGGGEGIQAKRRGYATLISHLTPPIAQSGLYGELQNLKYNLERYQHYKEIGYAEGMNQTRQSIIEVASDMHLGEELNLTLTNETFEDDVERIVEYIENIASETIPYGTHTLGVGPSEEKAVMFIETMYTTELMNLSYTLLNISEVSGLEGLENRSKAENMTKWLAEEIVNCSTFGQFKNSVEQKTNQSIDDEILNNTINNIFENCKETLTLLNASGELENLIQALDGRYVPPSEQGDPVQNPAVLPTGRNFYGFNSKKVPDPTTWEIGKKLADQMLVDYYKEHGYFPEKIAVTMWSVETMRHYGVMESMVLRLLGVEPDFRYSRGAFRKVGNDRVIVTPLDELTVEINGSIVKRPRIDVVVTTSGLYRDTLQYQMRLLDVAIRTVAELNESDNYVWKHSLEIYDELMNLNESVQQGIMDVYLGINPSFSGNFSELALTLSKLRIFAPPPGGYGVGIEKVIEAGGDWDSQTAGEEIGELYIFRMANLYTTDEEGAVKYLGNYYELFEDNLADTEIVFNSRSTSLYGVLDNDDFFQYVGGLSLAISYVSQPPEIKVVNLRGEPKVESLQQFLARELRARALNPLYLEGMVSSGYSGLKEIAELLDNFWGWQVTTPTIIQDYMWEDLYQTIIQDKYNLGLKDAFEQNPYAYQSITARMLEAIRKGYWSPSDSVKTELVNEYMKSVVNSGIACCHHTCGNIRLNEYIQGMLSLPGVDVSLYTQYLEVLKDATEVEVASQPQVSDVSEYEYNTTTTVPGVSENAVRGYEMTEERVRIPEKVPLSSSSIPLEGMLLVVGVSSIFAMGYLLRGRI